MAILFEKDWCRYPGAIVHYNTSNSSWLEFADVLDQAGCKNSLFHLALHNPALEFVDPFDPNLPYETKLAIKIECKANPWYFWREVCRIPPVVGDGVITVNANRAIISVLWSLLNSIDYYLEQIRQTGKTAAGECFVTWYNIFGTENTRSTLFTKGDLIQGQIASYKNYRKLLPSFLYTLTKDDTDNQGEYTNLGMGNRMVAARPQKEEAAANLAGRGIRTPFNIFDETPFLWNIHITLPAAAGGMGEAAKQAKRNKIPTANLFSSTPGMLDTEEGAYCHDILKSGYVWAEALYDCSDREELIKVIRAGSSSVAPTITGRFTHTHMGISDSELRERIAKTHSKDRNQIKRDFLLQWSSGNMSHPLDAAVLEKITKSSEIPKYTEIYRKEGYTVRWYIDQEEVEEGFPDRKVIHGLDTSEIIGRDNIAGILIDASSLEVVGSYTINESLLTTYSVWLGKFLVKYQNITLVPEAKSSWMSIRDTLLTVLPSFGVDPGRRIYSKIVDQKDFSESDRQTYDLYASGDRRPNFYQQFRRQFGFWTGSGEHSRELLYGSNLQLAAEQASHTVRDQPLINEIAALVKKGERIDHHSSKHDDHVVAWLLAHWFLTYARNLSHYGIPQSLVKRDVFRHNTDIDWKTESKKIQNQEIKDKIHDVIDQIATVSDDHALIRLESKLISLYSQLDDEDDTDTRSIEAIITETKERRSRKRTRARLDSNRSARTSSKDVRGRFDKGRISAAAGRKQQWTDGGWM